MLQIEHTDTFSGEANYCWVKRWIAPSELTDAQAVRLAKKLAGFTGHRCKVSKYGDLIDIRPSGICQVVFVSYVEEEFSHGDFVDAKGEPIARAQRAAYGKQGPESEPSASHLD